MVEAVGIVGTGSGVGALRAAQVLESSALVASEEETGTVALAARPLSPSTRADPTTGVLITEYFTSEGSVRAQIPSQAALAYLRSGLTLDGQVPHEANGKDEAAPKKEEVGVLA